MLKKRDTICKRAKANAKCFIDSDDCSSLIVNHFAVSEINSDNVSSFSIKPDSGNDLMVADDVTLLASTSSTRTATPLQDQNSEISSLPPHSLRISPLPTESSTPSESSFSVFDNASRASSIASLEMSSIMADDEYSKYSEECSPIQSDLDAIMCSTPETPRVSSMYTETTNEDVTIDGENSPSISTLTEFDSSTVDSVLKVPSEKGMCCDAVTQPSNLSTMYSVPSLPTDTITMDIPFDYSVNNDEEESLQNDPASAIVTVTPMNLHLKTWSPTLTDLADEAYASYNTNISDSQLASSLYTESCTITPFPSDYLTPCSTNPTSTPIPSPVPSEVKSYIHNTHKADGTLLITSSNDYLTSEKSEAVGHTNFNNLSNDSLMNIKNANDFRLTSNKSTAEQHKKSTNFDLERQSKVVNDSKGERHPFWRPYPPREQTPPSYNLGNDKKLQLTEENKFEKSSDIFSQTFENINGQNDPQRSHVDAGCIATTIMVASKEQTNSTIEVKLQLENDDNVVKTEVERQGDLLEISNSTSQSTQEHQMKEKREKCPPPPPPRLPCSMRERVPPVPPPPLDEIEENQINPPPIPSLPLNMKIISSDFKLPLPPPRRYLLIPLDSIEYVNLTSPPMTPRRSSSFNVSPLLPSPLPPSPSLLPPLVPQVIYNGKGATQTKSSTADDICCDSFCEQRILSEESNCFSKSEQYSRINSLTPVPEEQIISPNSSPVHFASLCNTTNEENSMCDPSLIKQPLNDSKSSISSQVHHECGQRDGNASPDLQLPPYLKQSSPFSQTFLQINEPSISSFNSKKDNSVSNYSNIRPYPTIDIPPPPIISQSFNAVPPVPPPPSITLLSGKLPPLPPPPTDHFNLSEYPVVSFHQRPSLSSPRIPSPPPRRICSLPSSPSLLKSPLSFNSNAAKRGISNSSTDSTILEKDTTNSASIMSTQDQSDPTACDSSISGEIPCSPGPPAMPVPLAKPTLISRSAFGKLVVDRSDLPLPTPDEEVRKIYLNAVNWNWLLPETNTLSIYSQVKPLIQRGPQCGIVALSMASQFCSTNILPEVLLERAQQMKISNHGEMFSAEDFASIARCSLEGAEVTVRRDVLSSPRWIVQSLMQGDIILVPYDSESNHMPCERSGHKAHWALVCGCLIQSPDLSMSPMIREAIPDTKMDYLWHVKPHRILQSSSSVQPSKESSRFNTPSPNADWMDSINQITVLWRQGKSRGLTSSPLETLKRSNEQLVDYPQSAADEYVIKSVREELSGQTVVIHFCKYPQLSKEN